MSPLTHLLRWSSGDGPRLGSERSRVRIRPGRTIFEVQLRLRLWCRLTPVTISLQKTKWRTRESKMPARLTGWLPVTISLQDGCPSQYPSYTTVIWKKKETDAYGWKYCKNSVKINLNEATFWFSEHLGSVKKNTWNVQLFLFHWEPAEHAISLMESICLLASV